MTRVKRYSIFEQIQKENPTALDNDLRIIGLARKKDFHEDGWEDLQNQCITQAGKMEIHNIEMLKYRRLEREADML